jgi:hypothetical protein
MLKKTLLFAVVGLCVSTFAATINLNQYDFNNLTAEQVNEMKAYLSSANKKKYESAVCSIALYKYNNPNEDLTLAKMEEIAKSVYGKKDGCYNAVLMYISKTKQHSKFANQLLVNSNYNTLIYFCKMVSYGTIKADNVNDFRLIVITKNKDKKSVARNVSLLINDCQKLKDEDAVAYLKAAYKLILPRLADDAELKPVATKIGLALRSYGVDVK